MSEQDGKFKNLNLLLRFMKGDSRIPDASNWALSINNKVTAISISHEEVLLQISKCLTELEEIEKKGYGTGLECIKLAIKYEVFLNSIYSLCENLSQVVRHLYRSMNLPSRFHQQKSRFCKDLTIDAEYSKVLAATSWYNEVHTMRTEATHYLSGVVVLPDRKELGYINTPKSAREGTPKEISIISIEKHVRRLYDDVLNFLYFFGDHFIRMIDHKSRIAVICYYLPSSKLLCVKNISLDEYLKNEPGICQTINVDCPDMSSCIARKKTAEKK